jgi:hypothetical protein
MTSQKARLVAIDLDRSGRRSGSAGAAGAGVPCTGNNACFSNLLSMMVVVLFQGVCLLSIQERHPLALPWSAIIDSSKERAAGGAEQEPQPQHSTIRSSTTDEAYCNVGTGSTNPKQMCAHRRKPWN